MMIITFDEYPTKWFKRGIKVDGDLGVLADAIATAWERRGKPKGDSLECEWASLCIEAVFAVREKGIPCEYQVFSDDTSGLGAFEIGVAR
jgi:hypothetical protein